MSARAEQTFTWTSNADFAYNKITGDCSPATLENLSIEGGSYTDDTCVTSEQDAALKLSASTAEMRSIVQVSTGAMHTLALASDGTVWAWGINTYGNLGDGTTNSSVIPVKVKSPDGSVPLSGVTSIAAGDWYSCAVVSGAAYCWGYNNYGQLGNGSTSNSPLPVAVNTSVMSGSVTKVDPGSTITCAIASGAAYCWGRNNSSQFGKSSPSQSSTPVAVPTNVMTGTVTDISAGFGFVCGVAGGKAYCWGSGGSGQIGGGESASEYTVTAVLTSVMSGTVTSISAGGSHVCAVASGLAYCWGHGGSGQLGNSASSNSNSPVAVTTSVMSGTVTSISPSIRSGNPNHTCAVASGQAYCWGLNGNGELGNSSTTTSNSPVAVTTSVMSGTVTQTAVGHYVSCAISDTNLYCWGNNTDGFMGIQSYGTSINSSPVSIIENVDVAFMSDTQALSTGHNHTCAVASGQAYCWGRASSGQLGIGASSDSGVPVAVDTSLMSAGVSAISAGGYQTCAVADGQAFCWGLGTSGQLGNGASSSSNVPVAVSTSVMSGTVTDISTNGGTTCAVSSGQAYCWGTGTSGQLGNGASSSSNVPVAVSTSVMSGTVTDISVGYSGLVCAVASGQAYCWGTGTSGQLGNSTSSNSNVPVAVNTTLMSGTVTSLSAGSNHACGVASGQAYCWGLGTSGQMGNSATSSSSVPVAVTTSIMSGTVTTIAAGMNTSCAVASGQAYCWGSGGSGQMGNGTTTSTNSSPLAVSTSSMPGSVTHLTVGSDNSSPRVCAISSSQAYCWASGAYGALGSYGYSSGSTNTARATPNIVTSSITYVGGYAPQGSLNDIVVDAGQGKKTKWFSISWQTENLPANTEISFAVRTSDDSSTWSSWSSSFIQDTEGSTTGFGDLDSLPMSRYIEVSAQFSSDNSASSPTLNDFTLSFLDDEQPPVQNANNLSMQREQGSAAVAQDGWTNLQTPYFSWDGAEDNDNGSGIQGYCLYLGQDETAEPTQTKGLLGDSPVNTGGACPYAVTATHIDMGVVDTLQTELETSSTPYYLLVSALDYSGNVFDGAPAAFSFKYDDVPPNNPSFVSAPSQFVSTKAVTLTWPTTGGESPQDTDSGVAGLQYRIGSSGTWYGDSHNGAQNSTDLLVNDGSYATSEAFDYPSLTEGNNIVYFRTYDQAGNVSESHITTVIKLNTSSPTSPQNLTATPSTNTSNSFAFSWLAPASYVGQASGIVYCYTINTVPTSDNCNYTNAGQLSLAADAFATQPGINTLYLVARDEANNINHATYASVTFTANTPAPGIVQDFEIADVSTKASSLWKLAISWSEPENTGAGVAKYLIERSTNGTSYSQVANTSGLSYVDSSLSQQVYHYKVKACDSANNCGASSESISMTPTGRFTSPPELVGNVSSQVGTKTARFTWSTDRNSDSRIQYGTSSGDYLPSEVTVSDQTQAHELELFNLEAGTTYFYKVKWTDEDGNTGLSSELSFTTLPAPNIKDVQVIKKNLTSAIVQFTSTDATKVDLLYGKSDSFGGITSINTSRSESTYLVELTGLDDGTDYSFRLNTYDSEGNKYDSNRTDNFSTPPRPRISNLRFQPVDGQPTSTQQITWSTNVLSDSTITYGKVGTNGTDVYVSEPNLEHKITVNGLEDDSSYFLLAQSRDEDGNLAVSDRQFFRTALDTRSPTISDIKVTTAIKGSGGDANGQIVVYWKTDEPATSQVAYGLGASGNDFPNRTAEDTQLTTDHVVIISDLPVANVYYLQPVSNDKAKNTTSGDSRSAVIGRPTDSILNIIINSIQSILGI